MMFENKLKIICSVFEQLILILSKEFLSIGPLKFLADCFYRSSLFISKISNDNEELNYYQSELSSLIVEYRLITKDHVWDRELNNKIL